jgi:putative phosphoribosyl transferase
LAGRLSHLQGQDVVVLGLPRGGVPVAFEVAHALRAPLDVIVVRKLGVPFQSELAMGAIGEGGARVTNDEVVRMAEVTPQELAAVEARERDELERRTRRFRGDRPPVPITGRTVVVVDDGIATGSTARAACEVARARGARRVVLAVPVASAGAIAELGPDVDEMVWVESPRQLWAVGQSYRDFSQTSDGEVVELLGRASRLSGASTPSAAAAGPDRPVLDEDVEVPAGPVALAGRLTVPEGAGGAVVFAHGSGSSRHSSRNQFVAGVLNEAGFATLLFDLLTRREELDRANVFDIELLGGRLLDVAGWIRGRPETAQLAIGCFGASTGAAAALWAAADPAAGIAAVVSRGGRPDLAGLRLPRVQAPTLLIVGGADRTVLELNRAARAWLRGESELAVVPGATHLFEEPGALLAVANLARDWFSHHLTATTKAAH